MSTVVAVNIYTHTNNVTYVTDQLLLSLKNIIIWIGLDPNKFIDKWRSTDLAVNTWLASRDLLGAVLEIYDSKTDALVCRWDFTIDYSYGSKDDGSMWIDTDAIRFAILKCGILPSSCNYRIVLETKPGRSNVPGWGPTAYRSTEGLVRQCVGTTIGTHTIGARAGYWRKN